jgi:hypothetical protein
MSDDDHYCECGGLCPLTAERDRLREHLRYIRDGREPVGLEGYARLSRRGMRRRARRALEGGE